MLSSSLFAFSAVIFTVFIVSGSSTSFPSTLPMFLISTVAVSSTSTLIVNVTLFASPGATSTFPKSTFLPSTVAVGFVPVTFSPSGTSSVTVAVPAFILLVYSTT